MTLPALFVDEFKQIFTNRTVLLTALGGIFFYSFLYPLPYINQVPRDQKIAVVNHDKGLKSYQFMRMVDATPQVKITHDASSIAVAEQLFLNGEVAGFLVIPSNFEKELTLKQSPTLSYAGDASYFLVYSAIVEGISTAQATLGARMKVTQLLLEGGHPSLETTRYAPVKTTVRPVFNPTIGYVPYVIPAIFVLLLQQTLIIASGVVTASSGSRSRRFTRVWTRVAIFTLLYTLLAMYYMGWCFSHYDISRHARPLEILTLVFPFIASVSFMGIFLGRLVRRTEHVVIIALFSSLPIIFCAGFVWPVESLPPALYRLSLIFPTTPAIQGLLSINQMGAQFSQVKPQFLHLWTLTLAWGILCFLSFLSPKRQTDPQAA